MCENGCSHEDKYLTMTKAGDLLFIVSQWSFLLKTHVQWFCLLYLCMQKSMYAFLPFYTLLISCTCMCIWLFLPHYPLLPPPTEPFFPASPLGTPMSFVLLQLWPIEFRWGCFHSVGYGLELTCGTPLKNAFPFLSIHSLTIGSSSRRDGGLSLRIMECLRVWYCLFTGLF